MSQKIVKIEGIGEVLLQKRKGARSVRLSVGHEGELRVSLPIWSPYRLAETFVMSKKDWVKDQQQTKVKRIFEPNHRIGKGHRLIFINEARGTITSRVSKTEVTIRMPLGLDPYDAVVQQVVRKAAVRALKQEATTLLPMRLKTLAKQHGFSYNSVVVKQLKTRWGSCSSTKQIALSCFLMQLPWDLIDYVLLHELVHTKIMAHGQAFWGELGHYVPNLAAKRRVIRTHHPTLIPAL